MEYAHTTRKTRQKYKKSFHETLNFLWEKDSVFYSSAIGPAVKFLQTLPTGCLQQDVVNENFNFKIKSESFLIRLGAGATCI